MQKIKMYIYKFKKVNKKEVNKQLFININSNKQNDFIYFSR